MSRFQNILVYLGDRTTSEPALRLAMDLASRHGARLELVDVTDALPGLVWDRVSGPGVVRERHRREQRRRLEESADVALDRGLEVTTRHLEGTTSEEIIREVLRGGHDLVVKTAQQFYSQDLEFMGTVDRQLMRRCPVPVWLIKPRATGSRRVVAAVDQELGDRRLDSLAITTVEVASALAERERGELDVVHVLEPCLGGPSSPSPPAGGQRGRRRREDARAALLSRLEAAFGEFPTDRVHVLEGHPSEEVPRFARELDAALLVMGTISSSGTEGRLIDDAAEAILYRVHCSVVTVKPDGYVSPVPRIPRARPTSVAA